MIKSFLILLLGIALMAGEYDDLDFDTESFEKKVLEYQGYLRSDNTYQHSDPKHKKIAGINNELNLRADLDYEVIDLHADYSFFYRHAEYSSADHKSTLNALYQRFGDERQSLNMGKEVLRWGKGYAYSPVAFFERAKNPIYPELSREGYWMAHGKLTRTVEGSLLKNYTLSLIAIPDFEDNADLFEHTDSNYGAKLYMLLDKTDIDLVVAENAFGADFSSDVAEGLELHGEYARKDAKESFLGGLRFQGETDLTLIAEYMKTFEANKLVYLRATQKEPFDIVYSTLYALYINDVDDDFYRIQAGGTYDYKNGLTLDLSLLESDDGHGVKGILYYYF
ncbi:MAG: hypothetical protein U9Q62_12510 [Campylobacterota bacterium]|nr:hypothetical protein [Campylobacterota bacterium]